MEPIRFKVFAPFHEIDLNAVANHFGIKKKFEWEDFFALREPQLKGIVKDPAGKLVNIFPFGSLVFINLQHHEIVDILTYLRRIDPGLSIPSFDFTDDYSLELTEEAEFFNNDAMFVHTLKDYQLDLLSIVLAKSVALEKIEAAIETLLDEIEVVINLVQEGKLRKQDGKLARLSARILRFKHSTVSYIMLLDKPDITWNNEEAENLYANLSRIFELAERYDKFQSKANTLMDIIQVFTSLSQHRKANTLEWMIIILILIELVISLINNFILR